MSSQTSPAAYPLAELIAVARQHAPYYRRFYAGLPETPELSELPVIDPEAYWLVHGDDRREVLTGTQVDGYVLNSSGTSGAPKFSYCAASEWDASIALSARSFDEAGLSEGDRVATLFATGNMYASQLFATASFEKIRAKVVQFPIGYWVPFADAARIVENFKINVLAGFPTHLLRIIDAIDVEKSGVHLDHILYAGEIFTPGQQQALRERFPGLQIHSAGYASVEGGPIGYADTACTGSEHRVYDGGTIIELLDEETGQPIEETGQPGRVVFTSLVRRLMPLIRYPTGDLAQWVEPPGTANRKFSLQGRAGQGVRVGPYNLGLGEVNGWLEPLRDSLGIDHLQIIADREGTLDFLTFRLVGRAGPEALAEGTASILRAFRERRPDLQKGVEMGVLHPPRVEWVGQGEMIVSERSGKILSVVDRRNG